MENPWASPWATADSDTIAKPEAAAVTSPEPPPAAFFSSTPNNIGLPSGHSAWTEDDSFGDWAAPEPTPSAAPSGWGIWGSGDGATADGHLTPKLDRRRKGSNPQWPNSRSTSPGLRPPPLSKRSSSDHLTLDPWASEPSFNRWDEPDPHIQHLPSLPTASHNDVEPPTLRSRASNISIVIEPQSPLPTSRYEGTDKDSSKNADSEALNARPDSTTSLASSAHEEEDILDNSHHDSPVTPADEVSPGQAADKTPSKVQKLVTMYDGIARKSSFTPELVPGPKRAASQESSTRESFGPPAPPSAIPAPALPADDGQLQIRKTRHPDLEVTAPSESEEKNDASSPVSADLSLPEPGSEPDQADVVTSEEAVAEDATDDGGPNIIHHEPFKVDLEKLDELFPEPKSHVTGDDVEVPDRIITDSFEATSERKVWYRISRYGPMRQHNSGDDKNYARISWVTSSVRPEIITTVRRWMEEDSIGGRLYRGASGKGAGGPAFGWNQPSTPVSLEEFFRRGKSGRATPEQNPRQSLSSLQPPTNTMTVDQRPASMPPTQASAANAWSGLASFGWSSETPEQPSSSKEPASGPKRDATVSPVPASFKLEAPPKKSLALTPAPVETVKDDESDDEWGDMVTPSAPEFLSKPAALNWETTAQQAGSRTQPPKIKGLNHVASDSTSQAKPPPCSGWNDAPLMPTETRTNGTSPTAAVKLDAPKSKDMDTSEKHISLDEAVPQSKPRKKVAFNSDATPADAPDIAGDAGLVREIISKLPNLSYMLQ